MGIVRSLVLPALAGFIVTAAIIPYAAHAEEPFAIVRPGDSAMTCPALATEINALNQQPVAAPAKKKHGFGFLKVVGAVMPGVGLINGLAGGLVSSAAAAGSAVADNGMHADASDTAMTTREATGGGSAAQQRKARLTALFDDHHC